jgi:HTH-type transcriptional regulator/antitoxin HigA
VAIRTGKTPEKKHATRIPVATKSRQNNTQKITSMAASASYLKLAAAFPIRPLRNEEELDRAIAVLDELLGRKKPLDEQEQGYFDSLSHEIERYETANIAVPAVAGSEMLRHLINSRDETLSAVASQCGIAVSTLSAVLNGKRELNRRHIEKLAIVFGVSPGAFLS